MFLDIVMGRKNQVGLALTPQAVAVLDDLAEKTELSRAEVFEAIAHGKVQLLANDAQWTFQLQSTDAGTTLTAIAPETDIAEDTAAPASAPAHEAHTTAVAPEPAPEADMQSPAEERSTLQITQLENEVASLQSQLAQAQVETRRLQAEVEARSAQPTPPPVLPSPAPPPASLSSELVTSLQQQLLQIRSSYTDLEARYQQQQAEKERLQQALAQAQNLANIGASQLNRWQYKTFAR